MPNEETTKETLHIPPEELVPTDAKQWGKQAAAPEEEGFIIELPSGNVVKVKRTLDMMILLKAGRIPNPLAGVVQRMVDTKDTRFPTEDMEGEMLEQLYDLLANNAVKMAISPRFEMPEARKPGEDADKYQERLNAWKPSKGAVSIFDVEMNDLLFLMGVGQGQAADLASFRAEQAGDLDAPQAGAGVQQPPGNRAARRKAVKR